MFPVSVDMSEVGQYILLYNRKTTEQQKRDSGMSSWLEQTNRCCFSGVAIRVFFQEIVLQSI